MKHKRKLIIAIVVLFSLLILSIVVKTLLDDTRLDKNYQHAIQMIENGESNYADNNTFITSSTNLEGNKSYFIVSAVELSGGRDMIISVFKKDGDKTSEVLSQRLSTPSSLTPILKVQDYTGDGLDDLAIQTSFGASSEGFRLLINQKNFKFVEYENFEEIPNPVFNSAKNRLVSLQPSAPSGYVYKEYEWLDSGLDLKREVTQELAQGSTNQSPKFEISIFEYTNGQKGLKEQFTSDTPYSL